MGIPRIVALVLLLSSTASADVDLTGTWVVHAEPPSLSLPLAFPFDAGLAIVQSGTALTVRLVALDESVGPAGDTAPYPGAIDPQSGEFSLRLGEEINDPIAAPCRPDEVTGVATLDGNTMNGVWTVGRLLGTRPCTFFAYTFTGVRLPCGNGVLDDGETCDDGNRFDGDCCSGDCRIALADDASCSDGDVCTTTDRCQAARCVPGPPLDCGPCQVCGASGCEVPALDCGPALAGEATLRLRTKPAKPAKQRLVWTWRSSGPVFEDDLGSPLDDTGYALCLIDRVHGVPTLRASAHVPAGGRCGSKPCWTATRTGFVYERRAGIADGLRVVRLARGPARAATIRIKGRGTHLDVPADAMAPPVTVRLMRDDAPVCWEATFSTPRANDGVRFNATSD